MPAPMAQQVLADPVGTAVALITGMEPGLRREAAGQAVTGVARGRAVRRRLARAREKRIAYRRTTTAEENQ